MRVRKENWIVFVAAISFLLLIFDAKTALVGASTGIEICFRSIIPALFPFLVLSTLINESLLGATSHYLSPLTRRLGVPVGAESLLIIGLLGGYPVGAQNINYAFNNGHISKHTAQRMLGFCNNAGPSFIFGILGILFTKKSTLWILWIIHIISALFVGFVLPGKKTLACKIQNHSNPSITKAVKNSAKSLVYICAWIVVFRIIIAFLEKWLLWLLPTELSVIIFGLLEITNGCIALLNIENLGLRFVLASFFLALGGSCVAMQTLSVLEDLNTKTYLIGKMLQAAISVCLSTLIQYFIFPENDVFSPSELLPLFCVVFIAGLLLVLRLKKSYSILEKSVV